MKQLLLGTIGLCLIFAILANVACDKERIVESTEYVRDVEYQLDTIWLSDTVTINDTTTVQATDTVMVYDTIVQTTTIYDTVVNDIHHYDTMVVTQTDTVTLAQCDPNEDFAISAMQFYGDSEVLAYINQEFGIADGWVFYLSAHQVDLAGSGNQYDIYGYIDYWTPEWDSFYALEFYWRLTYNGGDPANPANWTLSDAPAAGSTNTPGLKISADPSRTSDAY